MLCTLKFQLFLAIVDGSVLCAFPAWADEWKATAIQKQVDDQMNRLTAAMQAAKQAPQKR